MVDKLKPVTGKRTLLVLKSRHFKAKKENAPVVEQLKIEMLLGMRRELREMEEAIALALSCGAKVEAGIHTAKLLPVRKNGKLYLELVID